MIEEADRVAPSVGPYAYLKAMIDFALAVVGLIVFGPLMLAVALAIKLDDPGPAIYRQTRLGALGRLFTMYKFRTMKLGTPVLSTADMQEQQVIPFTRLGPFLRKSSLDELPQLVNIIKGEMSFIGPRPALPTQNDVIALREEMGATHVRPGITGLAQAMGRDELDSHTKVGYDAQYCRKMSLIFDIKVFFMTVAAVLSARGNK
ncbi:MAG: sugar transferase [Armatimonadetes bacterium]|nr:sugar transferase [Armatimonadota bacterium]